MIPSGTCIRISAAVIVFLVLLQVFIFFHLMDKSYPNLNRSNFEILEIYKKIGSFLNTKGYLDKSGLYKIIPINFKKTNQLSFDVTYILQCSWNRFHLIEDLLEVWKGPVSVAVFSEIEFIHNALWTLTKAVHCHKHKQLDLTLVVPNRDSYDVKNGLSNAVKLNESEICNSPYTNYYGKRNYNWSVPYPVNLLRNVAKSRSTTEYILVADIDMLPNKDLRKNFLRYAWSRKMYPKKLVFVIPAFEMNATAKMPQTKTEIILETRRGNLRPFYLIPCRKCHLLTNYTKWFSYPNLPGVRALYKVDWKHPWEPFYISYRGVPDYDERFRQYGFNRVSQICQLHIEGYNFLVLDNAFLIHKGFKSLTDFHHSKDIEMDSNRKLYEGFTKEIKLKYPNSNRRCDT